MRFPAMAPVEQRFAAVVEEDVAGAVRRQLQQAGLATRVAPGARVAVTAGSRGIARIAEITRAVVDAVRQAGGQPFVVPAMGSHGGATAAGQKEVLAGYDITAESMGAPVEATMEVVEVGVLEDGLPVMLNRLACEADGIVLVNRIKPHTSFRGRFESGLMKMMTIGLGSHRGATLAHSQGAQGLARLIPAWGRVILERAPVLMGVALIENAYDQIARVVALRPEELEAREPELLAEARDSMPRLLVHDIDVLVVDEIGKDISGTGMDTNVIGRMMLPGVEEPDLPGVRRIVALGLSARTHGNANGVGLADIVTRRLHAAIDFHATYANAFTSTFLNRAFIPVVMETDRDAIAAALELRVSADPEQARLVRIRNTLALRRIEISEALLREYGRHPQLEQLGPLGPMAFGENGALV